MRKQSTSELNAKIDLNFIRNSRSNAYNNILSKNNQWKVIFFFFNDDLIVTIIGDLNPNFSCKREQSNVTKLQVSWLIKRNP